MIDFMTARVCLSLKVLNVLLFGAIFAKNRDGKILLPDMNIFYQHHCHLDTFILIVIIFYLSLLILQKAL